MRISIGSLFLLSLLLLSILSNAQSSVATISGTVKNAATKSAVPYANIVVKKRTDSSFVAGTITNEEGRFSINNIKQGEYTIEVTAAGFASKSKEILIGSLNSFYDLGTLLLVTDAKALDSVVIKAGISEVSNKMDKKSFNVSSNISQAGGSVLQALKGLPGITVTQEGKVELRGSDKVAILIDGKQTSLTGFGSQTGLDNLAASAIERIEIINNPSSKYDANGNAGIINIIYKKSKQEGFNGKIGLTAGLGALWKKEDNLPSIRPQYQKTPKINPSISLNYRKGKINTFLQSDWLYTETLNKNEFVTRDYGDTLTIRQQTKRNRNTHFLTNKAGLDWNISSNDLFTMSGLYGIEKIIDHGDEPFFNKDLTIRRRLWQFLEDELKTTVVASAAYQHKFSQPGHLINISFNYTFHREDEKYFFTNYMPTYTGLDSFKLLSDEHVADFNVDYVKPLKYGRFEGGIKYRWREIPTNMQFKPGEESPLDTTAGGKAIYAEKIPALYGNYIFETKQWEAEIGLRLEHVDLHYDVDPKHNTYKSDGYKYTELFPSIRLGWKINDDSKISLFYNRRVDRPNEVDIRVFPKYDDAEIIKVGNPGLKPQFTNTVEAGYKSNLKKGYLFAAIFYKQTEATITRIATQVPPGTLIYTVFQNAGNSHSGGLEFILQQDLSSRFSLNLNSTIYKNVIDAFTIENRYPQPSVYSADKESIISGNVKLNSSIKFNKKMELQVLAIYLAKDLIPQGSIGARFSVDAGIKKQIQKGKGEILLNATDLFNTLRIKKELKGMGFTLSSTDYYETQVFRLGYSYKF